VTFPVISKVVVARFEGDLVDAPCDCLVVTVGDGTLSAAAKAIDGKFRDWLSESIKAGTIKTAFGDVTMMPSLSLFANDPSSVGAKEWLLVGVGKMGKLSRGKVYELGAIITRRLVDAKRDRIVVSIDGTVPAEHTDSLVAGSISGCDGQAIYMSEPKLKAPARIEFDGVTEELLVQGKIVGDSINVVRRLVNEPPNHLYPETFADAATSVANEAGLEIEVWDEHRLEVEGCRAILAVGQASKRPPRLVIMHHRGGDAASAPLAIVGKGVTFDSGGLSIKPSEGMVDMKCDMAGAATVVGLMMAIAQMKLPINVVGLCGLAENMISGDAYRLGDVIKTRNGTLIEILNTDAEGRVVLADTLDVAVQQKPAAIIDLATLTGACMVALGREVAGLMTNDESLCNEIEANANQQGELVWQLPMFDLFGEHIKSKVADIKNIGDGRWGGAITAAKFLERFVDGIPWVHIDIAGPAFVDSPKPHRDAGATGVMLRTLLGWLQARAAR